MTLPVIGITCGDPGGIGPEVALRALFEMPDPSIEAFLYGPRKFLENKADSLGLLPSMLRAEKKSGTLKLTIVDTEPLFKEAVIGRPDAANGKISFNAFEAAVRDAEAGSIQAVVTAPISKYSWNLAKISWAGHTDYFHLRHPRAIMSFWADELKVALFSHHIPLKEAVNKVRKDDLIEFILHLNSVLGEFRKSPVNFLVSGLNPHAGEAGILGKEEELEISPAVEEVRQKGVSIEGPFPPDTIFLKALHDPHSMVIALYHDQGLIGFKLLAFERGVNATLGLPFIRTSPDHGTAFDIAGGSGASYTSMSAAIRLAVDFCRSKSS